MFHVKLTYVGLVFDDDHQHKKLRCSLLLFLNIRSFSPIHIFFSVCVLFLSLFWGCFTFHPSHHHNTTSLLFSSLCFYSTFKKKEKSVISNLIRIKTNHHQVCTPSQLLFTWSWKSPNGRFQKIIICYHGNMFGSLINKRSTII